MVRIDKSSEDQPWRIEPVEPSHRRQVLSNWMKNVGLWGVVSHPQETCEQLWAARDHHGAIRGVALLLPRPGRTAMLFVSRPPRRGMVGQVARMVDHACQSPQAAQAVLVQALLDERDDLERSALEEAGFGELAWLEYMQRPIGKSHAPPHVASDVQFLPWSPQRRDDFLAMLDASYEQTLDCPGICGHRTTEDVLEGHRATGQFRQDLWTLLAVEGKPAGVMLLAALPEHHLVELVYLGIALPYRGQGWGRVLMQRALHQCVDANAGYICTAVDRQNVPARKLYRSMGFDRTACKLAMIRLLQNSA